MNRRALFATIIATVGFLLLSAPVYADISAERNNITVSGNCTNNKALGNYTYYGANSSVVNITQLNTTLYSNQNVWYEVMFNVSVYTAAGPDIPGQCVITGINFTLPETWARNMTSTVRLVNHTGTLIMNAANSTGVNAIESQLGLLYFNTTGYHINGSYSSIPNRLNLTVANTSNITLKIQFEVTSLDSHRSAASTTSDGLIRTYNVTLPAPSNMSMTMVRVRWAPSGFASANVWNSVNFNGTTLSTDTSAVNHYLLTSTDLVFNNNTNFTSAYNDTWWHVSLSVSESGHGDGEEGTTTTLPVSPTDTTTFIAATVALIAILAAALIIYFKYK